MSQEKNFFKLLKYSNKLKKTGKLLQKEDFKTFKLLLEFLVTIEENLHYSERKEYIILANDFLEDRITAYDFSSSFMWIYEGISSELSEMKKNEASELANFLNPSRTELGNLLSKIYGCSTDYNLDSDISTYNEQELKDYAKTLLLNLQEE